MTTLFIIGFVVLLAPLAARIALNVMSAPSEALTLEEVQDATLRLLERERDRL